MAKILIGKYEATIYPEGNGWTGAISLGFNPDGTRKRLKRKGKTKKEVKEKLVKAVEELDKGVKPERDYTVEKAANDFLIHLAKQGKSDATMKSYRGLVKKHIINRIGRTDLTELTADNVDDWLDERAEVTSTHTLLIVHGLLKRLIRYAQRRSRVTQNVATLVDTPPGKKAGRKSQSLNLEQATKLLGVAQHPKHRFGAYTILALVTGLRTEELRALTWSDVDLKKKVVYVVRAERHGGDTKTPESRRGLAIANIGVDALSALRTRQAAERLAAGEAWQDLNLVFCKEDGSPYTADDARYWFRKVTKAADLGERWAPRELRHTFVSIISDHGLAIEKISDLVGHSNTTTTETVYRFQLRPVINEGAEQMNVIFASKITKLA